MGKASSGHQHFVQFTEQRLKLPGRFPALFAMIKHQGLDGRQGLIGMLFPVQFPQPHQVTQELGATQREGWLLCSNNRKIVISR